MADRLIGVPSSCLEERETRRDLVPTLRRSRSHDSLTHPPDSVGNNEPVRRIENPFDLEETVTEVADWSEGHVVRTLGQKCNERASNWGYVAQYRRWHEMLLAAHLAGRASKIDPFRGQAPFEIELGYNVMPGKSSDRSWGCCSPSRSLLASLRPIRSWST